MRIQISGLMLMLSTAAAYAAGAGGPPNVPDLDVTYISITPRLPSYQPAYYNGYGHPVNPETNQPFDYGDEAHNLALAQAVKHYHAPGDIVTLTAHVVNHGGAVTSPFNWSWMVDGQVIASSPAPEAPLAGDAAAVGTGTYTLAGFNGQPGYTFRTATLQAGTFKDFSTTWPWQDGPHTVTFTVEPTLLTPAEISTRNNSRTDWTDAMAFFITVKRGVENVALGTPAPTGYNGFRGQPNFTDSGTDGYPAGAGSYSFEDWLQYHIDLEHDKFRKSVYPTAPNGIEEHLRVDQIVILDDTETNEDIGAYRIVNGYDSAWHFGTYSADNAKTKDWGLLHEWGHQLGLIDIYSQDMIPSESQVLDIDGYPAGLGHWAHQGGMMHDHGDTNFSEFDATGMNSQLARRRGYYGDWMYLMPADFRVRVLDNKGLPVPNAEVVAYKGRPMSNTPVFQGSTDADGYYVMPNLPAAHNTNEYKPGASILFTQHDNPLGTVDIVGYTDPMLFRVRSGDKREFFWLDVTDFALAYFRQGPVLATFPFQTHFASTGAPSPPTGLAARLTSSTSVALSWKPSVTSGVTGYRVYRAQEREYLWPAAPVALPKTATSFTDTVGSQLMVRYAVSAVSAAGESAFSNEVGVYSYNSMHGITEELDGSVLVADQAREQPIWLRPDFSPIETFGIVHNHVAAIDVATAANGNIAYVGNPTSYTVPAAGMFVLSSDGANRYTDGNLFFRPYGNGPHQWQSPEGVAPANNGNFIVTDSVNHRVVITDSYGNQDLSYFGTADLVHPIKTIQLPDGTYLTTDSGANSIVVFDANGTKTGTLASLLGPTYIARGFDGTLAVAESAQNKVLLLHPDGSLIREITAAADGSPLSNPQGVAFSRNGDLLISDANNRRVARAPALTVVLFGDVDGNGAFDQADVVLAYRIAGGLVQATPEQLQRGDVVKGPNILPDVIDMRDVTALAKRLRGK